MGRGGTINVTFACTGCKTRELNFKGSAIVENSKRTVIGLALAVFFIIAGHGFAKFNKTLNQCLGINALSKNRFYKVIKLMYHPMYDIVNKMCEEEKEKMKGLNDMELGSWKRAVVNADGVWHTRGHFSKNGSLAVKNYLTGGLLWFGNKCMRGKDQVATEEELFEGTSKSMEGVLADKCYKAPKEEGCEVEVV